jgi:hypothetical protein
VTSCGWCAAPTKGEPLCGLCRGLIGSLDTKEPVPLDLIGRNDVPKKAPWRAEDYSIRICPMPDLDQPNPLLDGGHSFGALSERCLTCGMGLSKWVNGGDPCSGHPTKPPSVSIADRYATFRETVERIVREEAPGVHVVTDFNARTRLAWFTCGPRKTGLECTDDDDRNLVFAVRSCLHTLRLDLGTDAMVKR